MTPIRPLSNILDAYALAWRARQDLVGPTLILVVVFGCLYFGVDWGLPGIVSVGAYFLIRFLVSAGEAILLIVFCVGCTRYFLLPDQDFTMRELMRWRKCHTRFAVAVIQIVFVAIAVSASVLAL